MLAGAVGCLAVLALAGAADRRPAPDRTRTGCPTLDDLPAGTAVLNDWGEGGYLMWRYPELNFVMNGYGDIYTDDELARNFQHGRDQPGLGGECQGDRRRGTPCSDRGASSPTACRLEGWTMPHRSDELVLLEAPPDWPDAD